jgi:hypothetical protein
MAQVEAMLADLRWSGMPEDQIELAREEALRRWGEIDEALRIHPANETAVRLFLSMATQWRLAGVGTMQRALIIRTGLDYGAIEVTARLLGQDAPTPDTFARLRILEGAAIEAMAEMRETR